MIEAKAAADREATRVASENKIKKLDADLETECIDDKILKVKCMDTAYKSMGKYTSSFKATIIDESDATSSLLANLLKRHDTIGNAVKQ